MPNPDLPMFVDNPDQDPPWGSLQPLTSAKPISVERLKTEGAARMREAQLYLSPIVGVASDPTERLAREAALLSDLSSAINWDMGDRILKHKRTSGALKGYRASARAIKKSTRWTLELAKVSEIFGPEHRFAGIDWHLYRVCASTKTDSPLVWLYRAVSENLTPDEVRRRDKILQRSQPSPNADD